MAEEYKPLEVRGTERESKEDALIQFVDHPDHTLLLARTSTTKINGLENTESFMK